MAYSRRFDPLDLEIAPDEVPFDEELPDYEPATAPEYDREDFETPLHTYHLRQLDRKLQLFVPYGPSASAPYKITTRSARFFSKKPEIDVWRACDGGVGEENVAGIWFDTDGPLPWRPRAHFNHKGLQGSSTNAMESKNFSDWTVTMEGTTYVWSLEARPYSLLLSEKGASQMTARFNFSARGTMAIGGAEAGDLTVYRDRLSANREGVEKIVCGLVVAIAHFRKMGRHYWNEADAPIRATSLTRELLPHRASITTYSTF